MIGLIGILVIVMVVIVLMAIGLVVTVTLAGSGWNIFIDWSNVTLQDIMP